MVCKSLSSVARALVAAAFLTAPAVTQAQDWTGQVTLCGWGAAVGGDFTPFAGAPTLSFDKSLSEVLEHLDVALFATTPARRGDFVVTYTSSSRGGLTLLGPASGEVTMASLTLAAVTANYQATDNLFLSFEISPLLPRLPGWRHGLRGRHERPVDRSDLAVVVRPLDANSTVPVNLFWHHAFERTVTCYV
ncbi:hypothetical protein [Yoonia sp.]|uniref:hypothetical protein n=1 Tax=Yoonia sp. TaxID=2212373 RepID=UPI0025F0E03F|nr:hypothetical protein [Yoonia sp.]